MRGLPSTAAFEIFITIFFPIFTGILDAETLPLGLSKPNRLGESGVFGDWGPAPFSFPNKGQEP